MFSLLAFLLVNILFGFLLCFYGKKIVSWAVSIFIILVTGAYIYNKFGYSQRNLLIFIVFAIIILLLFNFFLKLGLFLIGGLIGLFLAPIIISNLPDQYSGYSKWILLILVLVFAILTALSKNKFLALFTALAGANILSNSLIFLALNIKNVGLLSRKLPVDRMDSLVKGFVGARSGNDQAVLIAILIFTVLGYIYQSKKVKK